MARKIINKNYIDTPEVIVSAQNLSSSYIDFGSELDMSNFNRLGVYVISDVNDSETVTLKVLGKYESNGTDEFEIDGIDTKTLWTTGVTDSKVYYEFDVGTIPYIQLQAKAGTVGSTPGDLTIIVDKKWRN